MPQEPDAGPDAGQDPAQDPVQHPAQHPVQDGDAARVVVIGGTDLSPDQVERVTAAADAADEADGVHPLSEHVRLHLRHGGEGPDVHLLAMPPLPPPPPGEGWDGVPVLGYVHLDPTDVVSGPVAELVVHPAHRRHGVGRRLVERTLVVARERSGTDRLRLWAHGSHPGSRPLAEAFGFTEGRHLEQWRRPLDADLPELTLPEGVRLRSFRVGADEAAWLDLNARAFAHHPEQGGWQAEDLQARLAEPWFDPDGFLLAESGGDLVGFHWTKVHGAADDPDRAEHGHHGHEPIGEVYVVGVDPAHQGRGLGRVLTLAGLRRMAGLGLHQAMLYVEGDNATAQATYHGLGFEHWDTDVMFFRGRGAGAG